MIVRFAKNNLVSAITIIILAAFFALSSFMIHESELRGFLFQFGDNIWGMAAYVFLDVIATVIAPVSTIPLIPIASGLWGWQLTGVLSVIGWGIGAEIAFILARYFGRPLIEKFVSLNKLKNFEDRLSGEHLFWTVVFLRLVVPVDILSYAIGLFSTMKNRSYLLATLVGITPFAFIFAYAGTVSIQFQIITLLVGITLTAFWFFIKRISYENVK